MLFEEVFYSVSWVLMIAVVWFYTDAFVYYTQLLNLFKNIRYKFSAYLANNEQVTFSEFLYVESLKQESKIKKFLFKMLSCPFCLLVWLAIGTCFFHQNIILLGPIYILSLIIFLGIRRWI